MQIDAPHFCAGVELDSNGSAVRCAPILHYMRGWTRHQIAAYCRRKGWRFHDA